MVIRGEWGYLQSQGVQLKLLRTLDDANEFKRWLGERRSILGVDTETSGLTIEHDKIRLIQFGDLRTGWAIPWHLWSGLALEMLNKYEGDLVCHNLKFDQRNIEYHGGYKWPWHRSHDTMSMAHLVDPLRLKGLKPLSGRLIDPQAMAAQKALDDAMHDNKWTWATVPWDYPAYWIYGAMDPVLTCHIEDYLHPIIREKYAYPYDLELGTTRVISKVERNGARVNLEYCQQKSDQLLTWCNQARVWIRNEFGIEMTDAKLLDWFNKNDVPMKSKLTKKLKVQSLDKEVLESIDHPLARTVLQIKHFEKQVGPYFKNFINLVDNNNRVHANIWTMGTRTARMSITDPGLQTLPRKDPTVRHAFIPSDGHVLVTVDYDQIESRLMAHFSQCPGLIQAFIDMDRTGNDFFCNIASDIFSRPIDKDDEERQITKNTVYGKIYCAGVPTMAKTAGVDEETMHRVVGTFDMKWPEVNAMQRMIIQVAKQRMLDDGEAYVVTPTGRRLACDPGMEYALVNYLHQSHAAEILKRKMIDVDSVLDDDCLMILPVHDELVFDIPEDKGQDAMHEIKQVMADRDSYSVPITASADLMTTTWGSKYEKKAKK